LIVENIAYVANVGDSRAILSKHKGEEIVPLSEDHRPERKIEHERITKNGGHIYQTQSSAKVSDKKGGVKIETIVGPLRVFPGRLSVSRTFGDIEAKMAKYGGNIKVVIAEPEIDMFVIDETCDFFLLGCDGIYDKLSSEESVK
jgi:protein phosphatase 2C family protein 2/3